MNVYDILTQSAEKYNGSLALMMRWDSGVFEKYTYAEVLARAERFAQTLAEAGVRAGDRVAILAGNSPQWAFAFFGLMRLGACAVALDCALPTATLRELLLTADVRALLCTQAFLPVSDAFPLPTLDVLHGLAPFPARAGRVPESYPQTPDPDPEAAAIVFSSGTTSGYKGVVQTHASLCWAAETGGSGNGVRADDLLLATLPLSHLYGLIAKLIAPLQCGAAVCYIESNNAKALLAAFEGAKPTGFCCVPRVFDMFYSKAMAMIDAKGALASRLIRAAMRLTSFLYRRLGVKLGRVLFKQILVYFGGRCVRFMSGGAPLSPATEGFFFSLSTPVYNNYALTEAGLPLIANRESRYRLGTCGTPMPGVQMRIHAPDARGIGEIRVKSPGMMKCYFRNPEATAAAFDGEGWLMTGDTGRLTRQGELIVTGRVKENIILPTGVALSPGDIERQYGEVPGAQQLVVCGIPASVGSYDEIHAFVLPDESVENARELAEAAIRRIGESIPAAMRISQIHFVNAMPRTTLEKPRRFLLREQLSAAGDAAPQEEVKPLDEAALPVVRAIKAMHMTERPIGPDTRVVEDLGFDSLSLTELCLRLEELTGKDISACLRPHITVQELASALEAAEHSAHPLYGGRYDLQDFPKPRRLADRLAFHTMKTLLRAAWRFEVRGLDALPREGNYLLCPNHQTALDAVLVLMQLPPAVRERMCTMGAIEFLDGGFNRRLFTMCGGIPVDRRVNPGPAYKRCREVIEAGGILLIHPEGTRTRDGRIGPFKKGAARLAIESGRSLVPVRIEGAFEAFPNTQKWPTLIGRPTVRIAFGKPIAPGDRDAEALSDALRAAMLAL